VRLSLKTVNAELAKRGCNVLLERGDGYFYFQSGEAADWLDRTVRVFGVALDWRRGASSTGIGWRRSTLPCCRVGRTGRTNVYRLGGKQVASSKRACHRIARASNSG
jgi:hypothetical protein